MTEKKLTVFGTDFSHQRLQELMRITDLNHQFYLWVERIFRRTCASNESLNFLLLNTELDNIRDCISNCYSVALPEFHPPALYDGMGRQYKHRKACYYFFSWLVRDAPAQRLYPLIGKASKQPLSPSRKELEIEILSRLVVSYREILRTFDWSNMREVMCDRLEGSRRSILGHEREVTVRTAMAEAIQKYYKAHHGYGIYERVQVANNQITLGTETFDVGVNLGSNERSFAQRILVSVKTRETEGGGHAHLFTRDIRSAITVAKEDEGNFVVTFIVAANWSEREQLLVSQICDLAVVVEDNPNNFRVVAQREQTKLDHFIASVLDGVLQPKTWSDVQALISQQD